MVQPANKVNTEAQENLREVRNAKFYLNVGSSKKLLDDLIGESVCDAKP